MSAICPCDGASLTPPVNPPLLSHIAFRIGTFRDFRRALLTPVAGEHALSRDQVMVWRSDGAGDLAVMMAEWFAYLADILTFYNEQIANQDYLRTADLPGSVARLIRVLGYRPRPAIGATGTLAALVTPGQSAVLPRGLQFQSKPGPGQPPQTFELAADTPIGAPDRVPAAPPPLLLKRIVTRATEEPIVLSRRRAFRLPRPGFGHGIDPGFGIEIVSYDLLLHGAVTTIDPGAVLILRPRDPGLGDPSVATVNSATVQPALGGGSQTLLNLSLDPAPPDSIAAAQASLDRAGQSIGIWSFFAGAISGASVHLASLARQIRVNDCLLFSGGALAPEPTLFKVTATSEAIWDATGSSDAPDTPKDKNQPVPILHTVLTLETAPETAWSNDPGSVRIGFGWVSAGRLLGQPYGTWQGSPAGLIATGAADFIDGAGVPLLLQDANGAGIAARGTSIGDGSLHLGVLPDPVPPLQPPFAALYNLLAVTRGKAVTNEVLGSGDATIPGQSFTLAQSPVTYLARGAGYASTIALTVGGQLWKEVDSFYGQPANARVFVTREDGSGRTHIDLGDGINGARLPTGVNNVVASYRVGAGAASPPGGKLTVIAQSFPGLRAVLNPVAVGGGADPDPPDQIRRYAPRSVLTFGRAVSVFDYEALAALAPGVSRARAVWSWDDARQRTLVTVYVGDNGAAVVSADGVLAAAGDPNRPVKVVQATAIAATLSLTLVVTPGVDASAIAAAAVAALTDPESGLFAAVNLPIGQPVFASQIEATVLSVPGAIAITATVFTANGNPQPGPIYRPGEGGYYALASDDIAIVTEPDPNGG